MTKKEQKSLKAEQARRMQEMYELRERLRNAYSAFDNTTDCDMIDACIYEINALKSRYNSAVAGVRQLKL